jgi:hypothetical protein
MLFSQDLLLLAQTHLLPLKFSSAPLERECCGATVEEVPSFQLVPELKFVSQISQFVLQD